jgi:hypothetical protein
VFQVLMTGYEARWGGILFKRDSRPTHVRAGNSGMNMQKRGRDPIACRPTGCRRRGPTRTCGSRAVQRRIRHFMPVPPHFDSGKKSFAARTAFGCLRCKLAIRCVHEFSRFMRALWHIRHSNNTPKICTNSALWNAGPPRITYGHERNIKILRGRSRTVDEIGSGGKS